MSKSPNGWVQVCEVLMFHGVLSRYPATRVADQVPLQEVNAMLVQGGYHHTEGSRRVGGKLLYSQTRERATE